MERLGYVYSQPAFHGTCAMKITLNGKPHEIADCETISVPDFIQTLNVGEQPVLVELNREALLTRELVLHQVKEGDEVEVIRMVAGG